jgi:MFS family permease
MSAYILAQCVAQPLYGKMADIYGRKACLQASYILFAIGTMGSGLGQSMGQVIAGRAIQGAGGAGMVSMVSIVITDLVPLHEVATLWSYVNILQTTGRSCGGFLGGLLTQTLGWRW